jgi:hypothetical protein
MSDWMEEKTTQRETDKFLDSLDLFEFNGFNVPKFWFGDRVKCGDRTGIILGLEWRDGVKILPRGGYQNAGWWYLICLEGRQSLMGFCQDSLKISNFTVSGRSPPGGDAMS